MVLACYPTAVVAYAKTDDATAKYCYANFDHTAALYITSFKYV